MTADTSYRLLELLRDMAAQGKDPDDEVYAYLCTTDLKRLKHWLARLERVAALPTTGSGIKAKAKRGQKSNLIGTIFERLIRVLLDGCKGIHHDGNIRTSTSEIDFRVKFGPLASAIPMFRAAGTHGIGEAKCLTSGPKTEWINELAGLLGTHGATLAILFTACAPKRLRGDLRTAIGMHAVQGKAIVPFGLKQLHQVRDGDNFLRLLADQHVDVATHATHLQI